MPPQITIPSLRSGDEVAGLVNCTPLMGVNQNRIYPVLFDSAAIYRGAGGEGHITPVMEMNRTGRHH